MKTSTKIIALASVTLVLWGCGRSSVLNPLGSCNNNIQEYTANVLKFSTNPNKANCEATVNSLDKIIKNCSEIDAATRREYERDREDINCSDFNNN